MVVVTHHPVDGPNRILGPAVASNGPCHPRVPRRLQSERHERRREATHLVGHVFHDPWTCPGPNRSHDRVPDRNASGSITPSMLTHQSSITASGSSPASLWWPWVRSCLLVCQTPAPRMSTTLPSPRSRKDFAAGAFHLRWPRPHVVLWMILDAGRYQWWNGLLFLLALALVGVGLNRLDRPLSWRSPIDRADVGIAAVCAAVSAAVNTIGLVRWQFACYRR